MNEQEYYELVINMKTKSNLSRRKIAEFMHSRLPDLTAITLQGEWVSSFENSGNNFQRALSGIEPYKTYYELFIEALKPTEEEERRIREYLDSRVERNKIELPSERARIDYQI